MLVAVVVVVIASTTLTSSLTTFGAFKAATLGNGYEKNCVGFGEIGGGNLTLELSCVFSLVQEKMKGMIGAASALARKSLTAQFSLRYLSTGSRGRVLDGSLPPPSEYAENRAVMDGIQFDLEELVAKVQAGGGERAQSRHKSRNKLLARERIDTLVDAGTPFLEMSTLAGYNMYGDWVPSGGVVTGIGRVQGVECVIVANDATVKGGTYYPITVKKHLRAQCNDLPALHLHLSLFHWSNLHLQLFAHLL